MNGTFYIGAAGLESQQRALDVVANNIANLNTPGFKRSEVRFAELMAAPDAGARMEGASADASRRVFSQGELKPTGKPTDVAIEGDGFLELLGPDGATYLWRGGGLKVNADGYLAADNGMPLKAMIAVPEDAGPFALQRDGVVTASGTDGEAKELGRLEVVRARDPDSVETVAGSGLYRVADEAGLDTGPPGEEGAGAIVQGALEGSNVQLADEMVTLLLMQRSYAANAQVVQAGDQLMSIANGLRR